MSQVLYLISNLNFFDPEHSELRVSFPQDTPVLKLTSTFEIPQEIFPRFHSATGILGQSTTQPRDKATPQYDSTFNNDHGSEVIESMSSTISFYKVLVSERMMANSLNCSISWKKSFLSKWSFKTFPETPSKNSVYHAAIQNRSGACFWSSES